MDYSLFVHFHHDRGRVKVPVETVCAENHTACRRDATFGIIKSVSKPKYALWDITYSNYCAACLAKSDKDFLNKLKIVEEELDETSHWIELIGESGIKKQELLKELYDENLELLKIIVASIVTVKTNIIKGEMKNI